jgi:hypothetical protein
MTDIKKTNEAALRAYADVLTAGESLGTKCAHMYGMLLALSGNCEASEAFDAMPCEELYEIVGKFIEASGRYNAIARVIISHETGGGQ